MAWTYGPAGIVAPATFANSTDANTLDDYEEGTWTPAANGNWKTNPNSIHCNYVVVGRSCHASGYWVSQSSGSGTVDVNISGLPFPCTQPVGCSLASVNTDNIYGWRVDAGADDILWKATGGQNAGWNFQVTYDKS